MSWPNALRRSAFAGCLTAAVAAVGLSGCGFHPLYGQGSYNSNVMDDLADIRVQPLSDRQGQLLHNALLSDLSPRGEPDHPRYSLRIRLTITENQQALNTDGTATRDIQYFTAYYYLYEGNTAVTAGSISQTFSYDYLPQHYANISTQEDIQRRAALALSSEIRNRLAAYFTKAAEIKSHQSGGQ